MTDDDILRYLSDIFRNVFEDNSIILTSQTAQDDIAAWDSMSNIMLVIEIEHSFGIKIKTAETEALHNVSDLIALVQSHMTIAATEHS